MKIEFIKETDSFGNTRWTTEVDGKFVSGSLSINEDEAKAKHQKILEGAKQTREVISTIILK